MSEFVVMDYVELILGNCCWVTTVYQVEQYWIKDMLTDWLSSEQTYSWL